MPSISFWRGGVQLHLCRLYQLPDQIGVSKGASPLAHDFATQSVVIRSVSVAVKMPLPLGKARAFDAAGKQGCVCVAWIHKRRSGFISRQGVYDPRHSSYSPTCGKSVPNLISFSIYRRVLHNAAVLLSAMFHTNTMFLILAHQSCILDLSHYETSTILYDC